MLYICCRILEQHLTRLDVAGAFSGLSEHKGEPLWTTVGDTTDLIQHVSVCNPLQSTYFNDVQRT